jgi:hypothetical protein
MNVEIGTEAAQFPEKEYIHGVFVAMQLICKFVVLLVKNSYWLWWSGIAYGDGGFLEESLIEMNLTPCLAKKGRFCAYLMRFCYLKYVHFLTPI